MHIYRKSIPTPNAWKDGIMWTYSMWTCATLDQLAGFPGIFWEPKIKKETATFLIWRLFHILYKLAYIY